MREEEGEDGECETGRSWRRRRARNHRPSASPEPEKSTVFIPITPGATIRARYIGPGGGAINVYSGPDIALHVNPRPNEGLVLNSHLNGGWGSEERPDGFPFDGAEIALSVWAGPEGFYIQAATAEMRIPFSYLYAYRLPESRKLDRITIDIPGLRALTVQPEL